MTLSELQRRTVVSAVIRRLDEIEGRRRAAEVHDAEQRHLRTALRLVRPLKIDGKVVLRDL
jgi:hypothetical protein